MRSNRISFKCPTCFLYGLIVLTTPAVGQSVKQYLCSLVQNPDPWKLKTVTLNVMLMLNSHGPVFGPTNLQVDPDQKCRAFPIFPGELPQFSKNIPPYDGPDAKAMFDVLPKLPRGEYPRELCVAATGVVHVVDDFKYTKITPTKWGNGFGHRGWYAVGIVVKRMEKINCK